MIGAPGRGAPAKVAFGCERCGRALYVPAAAEPARVACAGCGHGYSLLREGSGPSPARLERCRLCGLDRLYLQKDFNRKLGLSVFAVAAILSVPTWGLSLLAATLIDVALYHLLGDVTICYGCGAQHRGFPKNPDHAPFDLHAAEAVAARQRAIVVPESQQVRT